MENKKQYFDLKSQNLDVNNDRIALSPKGEKLGILIDESTTIEEFLLLAQEFISDELTPLND